MTADNQVHIRLTDEEYALIQEKMRLANMENMSAYIRKMAIDGYVLKLELPELKEMVAQLGKMGGNINQIARRANENGRIYQADLEDIQKQQAEILKIAQGIYAKLLSL